MDGLDGLGDLDGVYWDRYWLGWSGWGFGVGSEDVG
jgi:hypothetical protein